MEFVDPYTPALTVDQVKAARHFDDAADDAVLDLLIAAAEDVVTTATNRFLTVRQARFTIPFGGWCLWYPPVVPVASVRSVELLDEAGDWQVQDLAGVTVRGGDSAPQIHFDPDWAGASSTSPEMRITLEAGHAEVPKSLAAAIILMVGEWHDAGMVVDEMTAPQLSFGARALIRQKRYRRPGIFG